MRITQEKVYPIDVALMDQRDNALVGENLGWRLETIVYLQLVRTYKPQGYDIYYLSDRSGECDFVVCKNNQVKQAIQVSYCFWLIARRNAPTCCCSQTMSTTKLPKKVLTSRYDRYMIGLWKWGRENREKREKTIVI